MLPRTTSEIRQAYLDFYKEKGHAVIPSASLLPENDPTVLFTTAGMHPLVPYLLGEPHPSGKRLVDVQRCIRTQDINEVGDASHLTFFEMLGNWSLGDYFKKEAIEFSFEFLTSKKWLGIPVEKLAVTCFEGDKDAPKDKESAAIWEKQGIPKDRIGFLPKKDNWWGPAGQTGPCGPDTEMFHWAGQGVPHGNPSVNPDDWMEIWNDVFMQYNKNADGMFEPLKQKNVDTGMGLERVAVVMQEVSSVYEIDVMKPILEKVLPLSAIAETRSSFETVSGKSRTTLDADAMNLIRHPRIITDHLRASVFIIADGVSPSNVDQGYVLRKLIRRAVRSGRQLNIGTAFARAVGQEIILNYGQAYPHLITNASTIVGVLEEEESQFGTTLRDGIRHFERIVGKQSGSQISGEVVFHLYDTYGFPPEITKDIAMERGFSIDEAGFMEAFKKHQEKSRAGAQQRFAGGLADHSAETAKLHTATHLLNAALRKVLGPHIQQKGSNITQDRLRFDFNHPEKMTPEQIKEVEKLVNEAIHADLPIAYHVTTVEGAKHDGAIGVFDDRYGSEVKVYQVGDGIFSKEICGGPHVARTGMIGSFTIQKEESSSAGIRRIKAVIKGGPKEITVAQEAA